jgi:PAS domain S-box-containing protein
VAELAQLHGGRTGVKSVLGSGSTFTVEVPFGPPADLEQTGVRREVAVEREVAGFVAEADRWVRAPLDGGARTEPRLQTPDGGPRVLVVDDNADMRDYVASLLAGEYRVNTAADGVEALQLAKAEPPDLVLTDVMMPRLDGFGLLKALREDPETLPVPVVMLSARAGEEGVIEGLEAGADDYLVKPFSARELLARVRANLELDRAKRTRDELQRSQSLQDQAERLAQVGSWEIDLASGLMRGSDQLLRMLGMSRPEFESLPYEQAIAQVVHPHDRELVRSGLEDAITTGEPFGHDVRLLAPGGERWVRTSGEAVADEHGEQTLLRGFVQDITQQREAEQAIAAAAAAREAAAREHQIADELQRSLLPPERFHSPQLEVVTYYQAGVKGTRIGGDWTDVIDLGAGRTAVVIGDVTGRGVQAATLMGQLRAAARSYAHLDLQPAELLERLDEIVWELGAGRLVTCIYGVFDPAVGAFRYANAGHPAPLLAVPGEPTRRLSDATGPLLGVGSARFTERFETLGSGSLIMLYTDGLIERRDRDLDASIDMLATRVHSEAPGVSELVNELVQSLAPEGSADDIAILMARIADRSGQQTAVLEVPPTDAGIREGRSFTTARLSEWSLQAEVIEDATLIVSELLTNAAIHGRSPIRLRLRTAANELVIEVYDGASALPRKLRVSPEEIRGRGLAIVAALSHRWAARGEGHGKTVWSTLKIPSAAE